MMVEEDTSLPCRARRLQKQPLLQRQLPSHTLLVLDTSIGCAQHTV